MPVENDEGFSILRETLTRFVRERLIPREKEVDGLDQPPADLLAEIRELGLFGVSYPEEYGGMGLNATQEVEVGFIIGRTTPAMRNFISIHNGAAGQAIIHGATQEQRSRYLPRLASGEIIGAFALTEPDTGSDARGITTRAVPVEGGWIINGRKRFISNATFAGLFTVMAKTPGASREMTAFLVEAGTPGMTVGRPEHKMGQHGAPICDVVFDDCRVGNDAVLGGKTGGGLEAAMAGLDRGRLFIAACCVGLAYRVIEDAADYALQRVQFGHPIAQFQLIQALLADSLTEAYAAEGMVRNAARRADLGETISCDASMCKLFGTEMVGRVADRALQVHGGNGYIAEYMIEQIYRDVRVLRIYEGSSQIQQLIIAKQLLGRRQQSASLP
jgi:acyl-CoA dehydrogenase